MGTERQDPERARLRRLLRAASIAVPALLLVAPSLPAPSAIAATRSGAPTTPVHPHTGPDDSIGLRTLGVTSPAGIALLAITVTNTGNAQTSPGKAVEVAIDAPDGFSFDSVQSAAPAATTAPAAAPGTQPGWACVPLSAGRPTPARGARPGAPDEPVALCTYLTSPQDPLSAPASLGAGQETGFFALLAVPARYPTKPAQGLHGAPATVQVSLRAPGDTSTAGKSARATLAVVAGPPRPALSVDLGGMASASPGGTVTETVTATDIGTAPASPSAPSAPTVPGAAPASPSAPSAPTVPGAAPASPSAPSAPTVPGAAPAHPAIAVTDLFPPGAVVPGSLQVTGDGWLCPAGAATSSPSCEYGATLAVGATTTPLTVTYRLDPGVGARLHLHPGGKPGALHWSVTARSWGASGGTPSTSTAAQTLYVEPPSGSLLSTAAVAANGVDQLEPGASTSVAATITNDGLDATTGVITVHGTLAAGLTLDGPAGPDGLYVMPGAPGAPAAMGPMRCSAAAAGFTCTLPSEVTLAPAASMQVGVPVSAAASARPGGRLTTLWASAGNEAPGQGARGEQAIVPIFVLGAAIGVPTLDVGRAIGTAGPHNPIEPVDDGSAAELVAGGTFTEQFALRNAGGGDIPAGTEVTVRQTMGVAGSVESASGPGGWHCVVRRAGTPGVECGIRLRSALHPSEDAAGPTLLLRPTAPTKGQAAWDATVSVANAGAEGPTTVPVLVDVRPSHPDLVPDIVTVAEPTAGGTGTWNVDLVNHGNAPASDPVLALDTPGGARVEAWRGRGMRCTRLPWITGGKGLVCFVNGPLPPDRAALPLRVVVAFAASSTGSLALGATASSTSPGTTGEPATLAVEPRPPIHAVITAPDGAVFDDQPLTPNDVTPERSIVALSGVDSGGSGLGVRYRWSQECAGRGDPAHDPGCHGVAAPAVQWLDVPPGTLTPATPDVRFQVPAVSTDTTLRIRLQVTDGSATATSVAAIDLIAPEPRADWLNLGHGKEPAAARTSSRIVLHLPRPEPGAAHPGGAHHGHGAAQRARARAASWHAGDPAVRGVAGFGFWTLVDSTSPAGATSLVDSTSPAGSTTTSEPAPGSTTTTVPAPPPGTLFCTLVDDALAAGARGFDVTLPGGVTISFAKLDIHGSTCEGSTVVSFGSGTIQLTPALSVTDLSGEIDATGIRLASGALRGPEAWHLPSLHIDTKDAAGGLRITFPQQDGAPVSIAGAVSGDGFAFVPLPGGWRASTSLTFSYGSGADRVAFSADATAPATDTSPGTAAPTISVSGDISAGGAFDLAVSAQRIVQIAGQAINLSGTAASAGGDAPVVLSVTGSIAQPITIVAGLTLSSLSVTWSPSGPGPALHGSGAVTISAGGASADIGVDLTYTDPADWNLTVSGAGAGSWQPLPGLTISPADFHGSIAALHDSYTFTLSAEPSAPWSVTNGVTLSGLRLSLSNTCTETGNLPCPAGASLYVSIAAEASIDIPVAGTFHASVAGALALPGGAFQLTATLSGDITIAPGFTLTDAHLSVSSGMPAPPGDAAFSGESAPGGIAVEVSGSAKLPVFGSLSVNVTWSPSGVSAWMLLGTFSLPGGATSPITDTVVGWSSFGTSLTITDPASKSPATIPIPAGSFVVSGAMATPAWFDELVGTHGALTGRVTGTVNLGSGDFSLVLALTSPEGFYVYGSPGSATSVRLRSVDFTIALAGADFSVGLGGSATLTMAGSDGAPPSEIDLGVALGFSATDQTISGSLTLSSGTGWTNALGVDGLTAYGLALQFAFDLKTLTPSVGIGADVVLPPSLRDPLGMPDGTHTELVANISLTHPCFGISVWNPSSPGATVLDIDNKGVLTATAFSLEIAPTGCTVGQFTYPAGLSLEFTGHIVGVSAEVSAHLGLSPFSVSAHLALGQITIGGATIDGTTVDLSVSPSAFSFAFAGHASVLGADVSVDGGITVSAGEQRVDLNGTLKNLSLGSMLTISSATVSVHVTLGTAPSASFALSGTADLLGSTIDADIGLSVEDGRLTDIHARVHAHIVIGGSNGVALDGAFLLDYGSNRPLRVEASVAVSVGGYTLASGAATIEPGHFALSAQFSLAGVFDATVEGDFYWGDVPHGATVGGPGGSRVQAEAGDFSLAARDVSIDLGGLRALGSVEIGRAGGTPWAALDTTIRLGTGGSNATVVIKGSVSGNGDFSFSGRADLNLAGTAVAVSVTVERASGAPPPVPGVSPQVTQPAGANQVPPPVVVPRGGCSAFFQSLGLCSGSPIGIRPIGIGTAGIGTAGIGTAGIGTAGIGTVGIRPVGIGTVGIRPVGVHPVGTLVQAPPPEAAAKAPPVLALSASAPEKPGAQAGRGAQPRSGSAPPTDTMAPPMPVGRAPAPPPPGPPPPPAPAGTYVRIAASGTLDALGVHVGVSGEFVTVSGRSWFRLAGNASVRPGGFDLGEGAFTISNFPADAGLYAAVTLRAGSVVNVSGRLTVTGGSRFYLGVSGSLNLVVLSASADFTLTNCSDATCATPAGGTTLHASGSVSAGGFSFGVTVDISPTGSFRASARSPVSGVFSGSSGIVDLKLVQFYAAFSYQMQLTVSSDSPYVDVSGSGSGDVYGRSLECDWHWSSFSCNWYWGGWSHIIGAGASFRTNPFQACVSVRVWGYGVGACIG